MPCPYVHISECLPRGGYVFRRHNVPLAESSSEMPNAANSSRTLSASANCFSCRKSARNSTRSSMNPAASPSPVAISNSKTSCRSMPKMSASVTSVSWAACSVEGCAAAPRRLISRTSS